MKTLFLLVTLSISLFASAKKNYFQQLCDFNPNWKKYESRVADLEYQEFESDREYIQSHLSSVLTILRSNPTDQFSFSQLQSRLQLIKVLDHYRLSGNFPINYYKKKRVPVFIDEHNTHCAVGYLLRETGFESLAQRIAAADNYVWVKDIKDPALIAWQEHVGFTLEELKLIQGAYDSYLDNALTLPNRLEIPQKPAVMNLFFDQSDFSPFNVWCKGEGRNGVLHGKWIQNYAYAQPWIVGYYDHGERTGKWEEYYQGTTQLCRTEHWKDDKLNGLRTRFNREGKIIEKIYFEDGKAITKINYDLGYNPKTYVRKPLDSVTVETQVFDLNGKCIAKGLEKIYNPGNLQWFQNIELTALNTFALSAETLQTNSNYSNGNGSVKEFHSPKSFQTPSLVEYKKVGNWIYYSENSTDLSKYIESLVTNSKDDLRAQFPYFIENNWQVANYLNFTHKTDRYDSLVIHYDDNRIKQVELITLMQHERYELLYSNGIIHNEFHPFRMRSRQFNNFGQNPLSAYGKVDKNGQKCGEWVYFNTDRDATIKYEFVLPEEVKIGAGGWQYGQ